MRKFPRSLVQALKDGRALPFVGAGVSRAVNDRFGQQVFPSWIELLKNAAQRLLDEDKLDEAYQVRTLISNQHYLPAAEIAKAALSGRRWPAFLREQFDPSLDELDQNSLGLAQAVWSLGSNFVVTTNYDRVLEWASPRPGDCKSWPTEAPAEHVEALDGRFDRPAIWHLHGTIHQADSIILTSQDYERLYPNASTKDALGGALSTLRTFLALKSFVFVGFSLNDERFLREVLTVVEAYRGNVGPHYAFIHRDQKAQLASKASELNLELIVFDEYGPPLVGLIRELGLARTRPLPPLTQPPVVETPTPEPAYGLLRGRLLGQRYELEERLGHGGFATVWRARDRSNGSLVALKILHDHLNADPERITRFRRGAQRMAALRHSNIVQVLAPVTSDGALMYFVMELLEQDLGQAVRERKLEGAAIVRIVAQLGEALTFAHAAGLIHRDVKPGNILLDRSGVPKLTDFDLVLTMESSGGTRTGALGTFLFAAPEVIADPSGADARADVFGLAMTAVFLFNGAPLGPDAYRNSGEFIDRRLVCDAATKIVLARACNWHREQRQRSVAEFCAQLEHASTSPVNGSSASMSGGSISGKIASGPYPAVGSTSSRKEVTVSRPLAAAISPDRPTAGRAMAVWLLPSLALVGLSTAWIVIDGSLLPESPAVAASPPQPAPDERPAVSTPPQTASPNPGEDDAVAKATLEALRRLQLPPTGSAKGVTRTALADIAPIRFIELTGGEFTVGSPTVEPGRDINETQHRVRVEPYLLAESEVSWRQWQAVMGVELGAREFAQGPNHPVQSVSWTRALEFLNRLSLREGKTACYEPVSSEAAWHRGCDGFRLPTEMEFEYAMRAGSTTAYFFGSGSDALAEHAWFANNAADGPRAVRQRVPNAWGFYDMAGNVWEWVWDFYATYPPMISPRYAGPDGGGNRVLRGGSFHDSITELRSANRVADQAERVARYRGFRVALDLR